jgi:glycosyltransferase involved in cell wall biosynthesis
MKLIVTIPAYNEEKSIGEVIKSIPNKITGIDEIEILVWDDGSTDKTIQTAKKAGADYVFSNKKNLGLAKTFRKMLSKAVELNADIVVNTDADNQYDQQEIPKLIKQILDGRADMVLGNRQVEQLDHMPTSKKYGNIIGSWTIRLLSGADIKDASTGFRAFTKECISKFILLSPHTYTHETIIQAVNKDMTIAEIPVVFKKRTAGQSRLITGIWPHVKKSASTIIRSILMYKAFKVLVSLGLVIIVVGILGGLRFLYFFITGNGAGHVQSLIFSSILINLGFITLIMGLLADLISINRQLIERK